MKRPPATHPDPLEQMMTAVVEGFKNATEAIQELRNQQAALQEQQQQQARAAYQGMTGSGKSRYVSELVKFEQDRDPRGAQARVAATLDLSPGRITQLLKSDKNRANGK